ncbi:MAG: hypothetical protein RL148_1690 [Planctomycetota bacterium]
MARERMVLKVLGSALHGIVVVAGGLAFATLLFLLLPLVQVISETPPPDLDLRVVSTADVPPPPPPPEQEPEKQEEQEQEKPPQLEEASQPLDLSQLELALNPGVSEGAMGGDFAVKLNTLPGGSSGGDSVDSLFSLADLDQKPRVVHQPGPVLDASARKKAPGTVHVLFVVDQQGRVENPVVQKSTDPVFERPALAAVRQWRFEPGKRNGQPVRFRMRVPITFPKGS